MLASRAMRAAGALRSAASQPVVHRRLSSASAGNARTSPVASAAAGIACLGVGFVGVFRWVNGPQVAAPEKALVVTSQEELDRIREDRFREGVWDASRAAAEWGVGGAAFIYGLRSLEPKMFGTNGLTKAGHPRLWLFITAVSCAGFAVRGEKKLLHATREYHLSGSAH